MSEFKFREKVVCICADESSAIYDVLAQSVFKDHIRLSNKDELQIQNIHKTKLRHATEEEIKAGRRLWKNI